MNRIALMVLRNILKVPGLYAKLCRYAKNTDKYPEQERWDHIRHILTLGVKSGNVNLQVTGAENIPAPGTGFMLYANHQGMFDAVAVVSSCPTPLGAVVKKELQGIPFVQQVIDCTKSFPMDREDVRQSLTVIQNVTEEVKNGRAYIIFPEGTRSKKSNQMGEFHGGSFRCAIKAKCPIVPVALVDCYKVFDQKGSTPLDVQIHYLKPIPYEEFAGLKATEVAAMVKQRIDDVIRANTEDL